VFDRYNIVSERDLHEAARRVSSYIEQAEKSRDGDNVVTVGLNSPDSPTSRIPAKLLN
jgi:hypothetical protein